MLQIMEFLQFVAISSPHIFLSVSLLFQALCWAQFDIDGNSFCSSCNSTVFNLQEIESLLFFCVNFIFMVPCITSLY